MKRPPFRRDEYLETLSRIKRDQPRRYAREVSAGQQVRVANYEREREQAGRQSARAGKGSKAMRGQGRAPQPDASPCAMPGSGMLLIPTHPADPLRLAEEAIEGLKREHPPRPVKTSKRKREAPQKCGPIGGGQVR